MADDFDPFASSSPTESDVDAAYDRYIKNLEKSVSDLSDDEVMKDVLDSFFASKGEDPQSLFLPTPETVRARIQDILDPEPPSYLRLVDEEPPDTGRAHGGFVVKPLYDS